MTHVSTVTGHTGCDDAGCQHRVCRSISGPKPLKRHKVLRRGDRLELEHGSCRKVWILLNGMTAMCVGLADGRRQILGLDVPGGIICGMSTGQHSGAWIEAFCDTVLCELELQVAAQFQADNAAPSDGMEVIANLFSVIHQRLERYSSHLVTLGRLDSTERVTLFLLDMAIRLGRPCGQAVFVELPMTREDIADYLGLNTETISRIFTRLKKSKLVQFPSRSSFSIPEPGRLERRLPLPVPHHMSLDQLETFLSTLQGHAASFDGVRQ